MGIVEGVENVLYIKRLRVCYLDVSIITALKLLLREEKCGKSSEQKHTNS